jgi:hypothetical protein
MRIIGYVMLGWLGLSVLATFGWVIFYELCARPRSACRPPAARRCPPRAAGEFSKIVAVPTTREPSTRIESAVSHPRVVRASSPAGSERAATNHRP